MHRAVDIIIPVYNALDDLKLCLSSLYKYTNLQTNRLIIINDNSPDPEVKPFLDEQVSSNVIVIHNEINKGFSANINIGMSQSEENDVILLNSDTVLTANWVEKLSKCAYSEMEIGTVTPLSNNATLCSVPKFCEENTLPEGMTVDEAAEIVERCSFRKYPEITVAHGFCMYVKREVINSVGLFDAETFGRGYGEENDFCNRAGQIGYKHVMCDDVYIYHSGTKSFVSKEKEEYIRQHDAILQKRYPIQMHDNAVHCRDNPNHAIGENVGLYFKLYNKKRNLLFLVQSDFRGTASDNIGGTQLHVHDLTMELKEKYNVFVVARDGEELAVTVYDGDQETCFRYRIADDGYYWRKNNGELRSFWGNVLNAFQIDIIHVHHFIGTSYDVMDVANALNIPVVVTLHDYYMLCPSVKMLDDKDSVCIGKDTQEKCRVCLHEQMNYAMTVDYIQAWRDTSEKYLRLAKQIIVPSESAKQIVCRYFPAIADKIDVIEHGYKQDASLPGKVVEKEKDVKLFYEKLELINGRYVAEGWAYVDGVDCREAEIWLEITDGEDKSITIPTTVKRRLDVSEEISKRDCGFVAYIPTSVCKSKTIKLRAFVKKQREVYYSDESQNYTIKPITDNKKLRVAFIGGLNKAKGGIKAAEIIQNGSKDISWFVFGGIGVEELSNLRQPNLCMTGYYKPSQLSTLLKEHQIDVVCILSLWPETYSYTLTEAILNKIPVVATKMGALGERVDRDGLGWSIDVDNVSVNVINLLNSFVEDKTLLVDMQSNLQNVRIEQCDEMACHYIKIYDHWICENIIYDEFDSEYIYSGYVGEGLSAKSQENISSDQLKKLEEASNELAWLKTTLSYKIMMRCMHMKFPLKDVIVKKLKQR